MLITEIERRPALYDCSLKEYSDKVLKEKLWGEVCEVIVFEWSQMDGPGKREKVSNVVLTSLIQMDMLTLIYCKI
jgi:hypothetical protein